MESDADIKTAYQHDDMRFLAELIKPIDQYTAKTLGIRSRTVDTLVRDVAKELKAVEARVVSTYGQIEDESFVWTIKISMIIYGAMELIQNAKLDQAWIVHAKSDVIWKAAQGLVKLLRAHLEQSGAKPASADIKAKYDGFLVLLRGSMAVNLPANFIQLMKHAGRIGRSYHSQALYLVKLCRELATQFEQPVNQTAQNLEPLKEAIDETIKALEAAKQHDAQVSAFDNSPISTSFTTARDDIKHCFEKFGLSSAWEDRETKLKASIDNDKTRMRQFNDRLSKGVVPVDKTTLIKVMLKVFKGTLDGTPLHQLEYSMRPTTRLTALQWQASKEKYTEQSLNKEIATKSYFVKPNEKDRKLNLDGEISSLASQNSQCELALVVG